MTRWCAVTNRIAAVIRCRVVSRLWPRHTAERRMPAPVQATADLIIDTSTLGSVGLKDASSAFSFGGDAARPASPVESFGFAMACRWIADMVMTCGSRRTRALGGRVAADRANIRQRLCAAPRG